MLAEHRVGLILACIVKVYRAIMPLEVSLKMKRRGTDLAGKRPDELAVRLLSGGH